MPNRRNHPKAFTLTELLLAVLVLLVVIAATARIFGTAQRVSSVGEANASILQDAGAIERRLRDDLKRMSDQGYMAIRNFAVRNDINDNAGTTQLELLNPDLAADAILRLDQLVFFAEGAQDTVDFVGTVNLNGGSVPSSTLSRITYGHAVQVPDRVEQALSAPATFDPDYFMPDGKVLTPWVTDAVADGPSLKLTATASSGGTKTVNGTQPGARDWILSRRSMLLADDGGDTAFHAIPPNTPQLDANSTTSLFQESTGFFTAGAALQPARAILSGRFDVTAMQLNDLERVLGRFDGTGGTLDPPFYAPWIVVPGVTDIPGSVQSGVAFGAVRQRVINGTFGIGASANQAGTNVQVGLNSWPRAERQPPTTEKSDQMLTSGMIGGHCSSFIVEWCWKDGVGRVMEDDRRVKLALDPISGNGTVPMLGFLAPTNGVAPWVGLPDEVSAFGLSVPFAQRRGSRTLEQVGGVSAPIFAPSIEGPAGAQVLPVVGGGIPAARAWCYTSVFGFNGTEPTFRVRSNQNPVTGAVAAGQPTEWIVPRLDYTPRPSALRITMTLHDPDRRIDGGREFTFVIDLPERSKP
jgi:type II secretory pathway pseudopilin PulG